MKKTCLKIRDNFSLYTDLIEKEKIINATTITLQQGDHNRWREKIEVIDHNSHEEILFGVAQHKIDSKYGLKIFIKHFTPEPVFYFDSDGPSHNNRDEITTLTERKINTPHINYYNENGVKLAKRNQFIEDNEEELQNDIELGMKFFCQEANINQNKVIPNVLPYGLGILPLQQKLELDVHKGINFFDEN